MSTRRLLLVACFVLIIAVCGCRKSASIDDSPAATTLRIPDDCEDKSSCCTGLCKDYCQGQQAKYFKHDLNGQTCLCWCER